MKFRITAASGYRPRKNPLAEGAYQEPGRDRQWFIEIDTLEELMKLCDEAGYDLIISPHPPSILIHDDYIE